MNKIKFIAIIVSFLLLLSSCQKFAEGVTGSKRSKSSDEFFVQKKSPLVLPPDFNEMPLPDTKKKKKNSVSIEELFVGKKDGNDTKIIETQTNSPVEKLILEKINAN